MIFNPNNLHSYIETVEDLIYDERVQSMRQYSHHVDIDCFEHSVFVSYVAFRLARRLNLDYVAAARGGLLHDLYLYDSKVFRDGHYLNHPQAACDNAREICDLSEKEQDIIISHMWPISRKMPRSKEAMIVNLADKYCSVLEVMRIWHRMKVRTHLPEPQLA